MDPKECICQIFVPTTGGDENLGNIGTGYALNDNLIITASHLLKNWDTDRPIEVSWYSDKLKPCPSKWQKCGEPHVLGGSEAEQIDVAVIDCDIPDEICCHLSLAEQSPGEGDRWMSEGFASTGSRDKKNRRKSFAMGGEILTKPRKDVQFQLTNVHVTNKPEEWKGVSGSPVIIGRSIVGVIVSFPDCKDPETLQFTPSARFVDDPKLLKLMGYEEKQKRREEFQ